MCFLYHHHHHLSLPSFPLHWLYFICYSNFKQLELWNFGSLQRKMLSHRPGNSVIQGAKTTNTLIIHFSPFFLKKYLCTQSELQKFDKEPGRG